MPRTPANRRPRATARTQAHAADEETWLPAARALLERAGIDADKMRRLARNMKVGRGGYDRAEWIAAARRMLIREGIAAVKVDRLAKALKVTRGGFYWRFKRRADLLDALLEDWRVNNCRTMLEALRGPGSPIDRCNALVKVWIDEIGFDPKWDKAMRDWARTSKKVANAVRAVDDERIEAFRQLFLDAGQADGEAFIRARVFYYHQLGYYAADVKEPRAQRWEAMGLYTKVLTGFSEEILSQK